MIRQLVSTVWALTLLNAVAAAPKKYGEITLRNGLKLTDVVVTSVEPDGLRLRHDSGVGKITIEDLPDDVRSEFGLDALAASDFRMRKKLEKDGLDGEARALKVRLLKETPQLEQDEQQERVRKEIFNTLNSKDYNFAEVDTRLMERAALWRDAGRDDLADVLESDRETLRTRENTRKLEKSQSREDALRARITALENRPALGVASAPPPLYRSSYTPNSSRSYWNYYPVVVVSANRSYCAPRVSRPSPVIRPAQTGHSNGVIQGSHLWRKP